MSHFRAGGCGFSSPSDFMMAFTVKLSSIFRHVSVLKSKMKDGALPFPIVTAVLNLGFDKCYQLIQIKHPCLGNFSPCFYKRKYLRFLYYLEFLQAKFSDT